MRVEESTVINELRKKKQDNLRGTSYFIQGTEIDEIYVYEKMISRQGYLQRQI